MKYINEHWVVKFEPSEEEGSVKECVICLGLFEKDEELIGHKCNEKHLFHKGCMEKWGQVSMKCPICR